MKRFLAAFITLVSLAWAATLLWPGSAAPVAFDATNVWALRDQALNLSGLLSFSLLSLAMVLATRPVWLERSFGGMDRIYRSHKWAGILAVGFAALHWLAELSAGTIRAQWGVEGRLSRTYGSSAVEAMRDLAEPAGEIAIYALLLMLALSLWKRFPFHIWRLVHKAMPLLYLTLAFHAAFLAPQAYWTQPAGLLLAVLIAAGSLASLQALGERIGYRRRVGGVVEAVTQPAPGLADVQCRLDKGWRGHRPGQFAFVRFDDGKGDGAHPFTIASADQGDRRLRFGIKALGDYTDGLAARLQPGQAVEVEGPYGCFELPSGASHESQVWIAGGVGVTPFLAWLDALQATPDQAPAVDFYYSVRDRSADPFVARVEALCAKLPSVRLHVLSAAHHQQLTAATLRNSPNAARLKDIWYCGPRGLVESLRSGLRASGLNAVRFHHEAFEMR